MVDCLFVERFAIAHRQRSKVKEVREGGRQGGREAGKERGWQGERDYSLSQLLPSDVSL